MHLRSGMRLKERLKTILTDGFCLFGITWLDPKEDVPMFILSPVLCMVNWIMRVATGKSFARMLIQRFWPAKASPSA